MGRYLRHWQSGSLEKNHTLHTPLATGHYHLIDQNPQPDSLSVHLNAHSGIVALEMERNPILQEMNFLLNGTWFSIDTYSITYNAVMFIEVLFIIQQQQSQVLV